MQGFNSGNVGQDDRASQSHGFKRGQIFRSKKADIGQGAGLAIEGKNILIGNEAAEMNQVAQAEVPARLLNMRQVAVIASRQDQRDLPALAAAKVSMHSSRLT